MDTHKVLPNGHPKTEGVLLNGHSQGVPKWTATRYFQNVYPKSEGMFPNGHAQVTRCFTKVVLHEHTV